MFCESREDAETVVGILRDWLAVRGLTLSEEKTRIVHLTDGFDFLGFNVRRYRNPRAKAGYTLLIKPSDASVKKLRARLREEWRALAGHSVEAIARRLNPLIRGWANYYRMQVASATFHELDHYMTTRELRYAKRMHPTKSYAWRKARYWGKHNPQKGDTWVFGSEQTGSHLLLFRWFKIERHVLVAGTSSPDDPRLRDYWERRKAARAKDLRPSLQRIARNQGHVCRRCGETLFNGEDIHKHHIIPKAEGAKIATTTSKWYTCIAISRYTAALPKPSRALPMNRRARGCASGLLEPDAVKVARPVLRGLRHEAMSVCVMRRRKEVT